MFFIGSLSCVYVFFSSPLLFYHSQDVETAPFSFCGVVFGCTLTSFTATNEFKERAIRANFDLWITAEKMITFSMKSNVQAQRHIITSKIASLCYFILFGGANIKNKTSYKILITFGYKLGA